MSEEEPNSQSEAADLRAAICPGSLLQNNRHQGEGTDPRADTEESRSWISLQAGPTEAVYVDDFGSRETCEAVLGGGRRERRSSRLKTMEMMKTSSHTDESRPHVYRPAHGDSRKS